MTGRRRLCEARGEARRARGGRISKLVDPAHRFISSGTSKLCSSMFRKCVTAPPAAPEEDRQSREDVSQIAQIASAIPSSGIQNGDEDNRTNNSDTGGIADIEQQLKDKIFTRVESDRLAELLQSRTVDTFNAEHEHSNVKKEKPCFQAQEIGIGSSKEHIAIDETASPAELAKAYMISWPSKVSPSVGSLRNQIFQEDADLPSLPSTFSGGFGISSFASATSGAKPFQSSSGFSFSSGVGSSSASSSSSFVPSATTGLFGSSSQASAASIFSLSSSSSTSSLKGFSFGSSASCSGSSSFTFGSSPTPVFSFTSAGATPPPSSAQAPVFGMPSPAVGFTSTGNDQMNDANMTDVTNLSASAFVPIFGQSANPIVFGSPAIQPGPLPAFQFGSHQNPFAPQNPSPFQSAGNVEFAGGSFSLDSEGGGDNSSRKFVKVRRDKHRVKR